MIAGITLIIDLLTALATIAAALAALCALSTWRAQMISERRAAVAQEALANAYAYEEFFRASRDEQGAINTPPERPTSLRMQRINDKNKSPLIHICEVIDRNLRQQRRDLLERLQLDKQRLRAAFGSDAAAKPIDAMLAGRDEVLARLKVIVVQHKKGAPTDALQQEVFSASGTDPATQQMSAAVKELEAICAPALLARDATAGGNLCDRMLARISR